MAYAYRSLEDGQIVVSDEPRTDLETLTRWERITDDEAQAALAEAALDATDPAVAELAAYIEERGLTAADILATLTAFDRDVIETIPGTENEPPVEIVGEPVTDEESANLPAAVATLPDGTEVTGELPVAPKTPRSRKKPAEA